MSDMQKNEKLNTWIAKIFQKLAHKVVHSLDTEEVLWGNEVEANLLMEKILYLNGIVLITMPVLNFLGIYHLCHVEQILALTVIGLIMLLGPAFYCHKCKGRDRRLKLIMLISMVFVYGISDLVLGYRATLLMAIPTVLAARYYSLPLVVFIEILTTIVFGLSSAYGMYVGEVDLNYVTLAPNVVLHVDIDLLHSVEAVGYDLPALKESMILRYFLPKLLLFSIVAVACSGIARRGYHMVVDQAKISKEHARVETELNMASRIQNRALPIVHTLEEHPSFDLSASMEPAKEVGGDFYDFFYLDPTHLALMIADVSGKGVPGALFMMVSKILLDNSLSSGKTPGQVLAEVNHQLCEKNLEDMFVTAWLGVLDLETGKLVTANAGHEYPMICRNDGEFEVIKDKHGLVLGGMDGMRYPEMEFMLSPGDTLFVYTDGVPEANNEQLEQFGMERTLQALNAARQGTMEELLDGLKKSISAFVGETPQFDDTTMLALRLNHYLKQEGISGAPTPDSTAKVAAYVEKTLEENAVPMADANRVMIAVDEIYSNIVQYSGAVWASVICSVQDGEIRVEFKDNGTPYDPLQKEDPDIDSMAVEPSLGGLGIFMTKKLMRDIQYEYKKGYNKLTLIYKF